MAMVLLLAPCCIATFGNCAAPDVDALRLCHGAERGLLLDGGDAR